MVGLLDIAEIEDGEVTVDIKGQPLAIKGLSAREIKQMLRRFPALDKALSGDKGASGEAILDAVPQAMEELALMGTFHENDEKRELARTKFQDFKVHEQLKVLNAIMENTFGEHWNPLVAKAKAWVADAMQPEGKDQKDLGTVPPTELLKQLRSSLRSKTSEKDLFGTSAQGNSPHMPS